MTRDESNHIDMVSRASLPAAAQPWLDRALPGDLDLPSSIRIEQEAGYSRQVDTLHGKRYLHSVPPFVCLAGQAPNAAWRLDRR